MQQDQNKFILFEHSSLERVRELRLSPALSWHQYRNSHERLVYNNQNQHTLSLYLKGGIETHRVDKQASTGGPGLFCLMPRQSESKWQLGRTSQDFVHLYFDDLYLKRLALRVFDVDPRHIELPEKTFFQSQALEALCRHGMIGSDWIASHHLAHEQLTDSILVQLLQSARLCQLKGKLTGGLSPKVLSQVKEYIDANYGQKIQLRQLAELAGLSEYHFCRMFKQSLAQTPQAYLTQVRIEKAQTAHCPKTLSSGANSPGLWLCQSKSYGPLL